MFTGITVNGYRIDTTDHFDKRLQQRDINLSDVVMAIKEHPEVFDYNNTGKELCYRSKDISFIFQVRYRKIVLISGMSWFAKYVKNAIVI